MSSSCSVGWRGGAEAAVQEAFRRLGRTARARAGPPVLGHERQILRPVTIGEEDVHRPDAPLRHVMRNPRHHHSCHPCHNSTMTTFRQPVNRKLVLCPQMSPDF